MSATSTADHGYHWLHALCRYRRYRVYWSPSRVSICWRPDRTPRCGCWSAGSRWGASSASPPSGVNGQNRWSASFAELGLTDETLAELGHDRPRGALRGDLRHHRRRGRAAGRQRRRHPRRHRAGAAAGRHAASRVVDRGGGRLRRRVHRGRLRRRPAAADAVPPDEVRSRVAGALGARTALPRLPPRRSGGRLPHRRDGQDRRPVLLLRRAGQVGGVAEVHPDPAARHRPHQHRPGRLRRRRARRTDARRRARRADVPSDRTENALGCGASTAVSPRRPDCLRCAGRCPARWPPRCSR